MYFNHWSTICIAYCYKKHSFQGPRVYAETHIHFSGVKAVRFAVPLSRSKYFAGFVYDKTIQRQLLSLQQVLLHSQPHVRVVQRRFTWARLKVRNIYFMMCDSVNLISYFSRAYQSLKQIRTRHAVAAKKCRKTGLGLMSQYDMIVTQFGFFGFALQNPRYFALTNEPNENWEGLLHFWRTIGYLLGIDER